MSTINCDAVLVLQLTNILIINYPLVFCINHLIYNIQNVICQLPLVTRAENIYKYILI